MNLPNEIIGGGLLIVSICVALIIRYALIWRADILDTRTRLVKIEEEMQRHPQTCPLKQQMEELIHPRLILPEKNSLDSTELIRQYIQIYYPVFMELITHHTCEKLTPAEELLCMMIKLDYSNKEISAITSIATNSVITARYRLKKKLSLPQEQQLDVWIKQLNTPNL